MEGLTVSLDLILFHQFISVHFKLDVNLDHVKNVAEDKHEAVGLNPSRTHGGK